MQPDLPERAPLAALLGGYGGLIPFAAGAVLVWVPDFADLALRALIAYGAVILSFVGAVHWGIAVATPHLVNRDAVIWASVLPALVAWPLLLVGFDLALPSMALAFIAVRLVEARLATAYQPPWFRRLRSHLTTGAAAALFVAWLAAR